MRGALRSALGQLDRIPCEEGLTIKNGLQLVAQLDLPNK